MILKVSREDIESQSNKVFMFVSQITSVQYLACLLRPLIRNKTYKIFFEEPSSCIENVGYFIYDVLMDRTAHTLTQMVQ